MNKTNGKRSNFKLKFDLRDQSEIILGAYNEALDHPQKMKKFAYSMSELSDALIEEAHKQKMRNRALLTSVGDQLIWFAFKPQNTIARDVLEWIRSVGHQFSHTLLGYTIMHTIESVFLYMQSKMTIDMLIFNFRWITGTFGLTLLKSKLDKLPKRALYFAVIAFSVSSESVFLKEAYSYLTPEIVKTQIEKFTNALESLINRQYFKTFMGVNLTLYMILSFFYVASAL